LLPSPIPADHPRNFPLRSERFQPTGHHCRKGPSKPFQALIERLYLQAGQVPVASWLRSLSLALRQTYRPILEPPPYVRAHGPLRTEPLLPLESCASSPGLAQEPHAERPTIVLD